MISIGKILFTNLVASIALAQGEDCISMGPETGCTIAGSEAYEYGQDLNFNRTIDGVVDSWHRKTDGFFGMPHVAKKACVPASGAELKSFYQAILKIKPSTDLPKNIPWSNPDLAEKALYFYLSSEKAQGAAECLGKNLRYMTQPHLENGKAIDPTKKYTQIEEKAIDAIAKNLDDMREDELQIDSASHFSYAYRKDVNPQNWARLQRYKEDLNRRKASLWMIENPKMQDYVNLLVNSGISAKKFMELNSAPNLPDSKTNVDLKSAAWAANQSNDLVHVVNGMGSDALHGQFSFSFRKGAVIPILNQVETGAKEMASAHLTGKFKSNAQTELVLYSGLLQDLAQMRDAKNKQIFDPKNLSCRLYSEFVSGSSRVNKATSILQNTIIGGTIAAGAALEIGSLGTATPGEAVVGAGAMALASRMGLTYVTLSMIPQILNDCNIGQPVSNQCQDWNSWQANQVRTVQIGSCLQNIGLAAWGASTLAKAPLAKLGAARTANNSGIGPASAARAAVGKGGGWRSIASSEPEHPITKPNARTDGARPAVRGAFSETPMDPYDPGAAARAALEAILDLPNPVTPGEFDAYARLVLNAVRDLVHDASGGKITSFSDVGKTEVSKTIGAPQISAHSPEIGGPVRGTVRQFTDNPIFLEPEDLQRLEEDIDRFGSQIDTGVFPSLDEHVQAFGDLMARISDTLGRGSYSAGRSGSAGSKILKRVSPSDLKVLNDKLENLKKLLSDRLKTLKGFAQRDQGSVGAGSHGPRVTEPAKKRINPRFDLPIANDRDLRVSDEDLTRIEQARRDAEIAEETGASKFVIDQAMDRLQEVLTGVIEKMESTSVSVPDNLAPNQVLTKLFSPGPANIDKLGNTRFELLGNSTGKIIFQDRRLLMAQKESLERGLSSFEHSASKGNVDSARAPQRGFSGTRIETPANSQEAATNAEAIRQQQIADRMIAQNVGTAAEVEEQARRAIEVLVRGMVRGESGPPKIPAGVQPYRGYSAVVPPPKAIGVSDPKYYTMLDSFVVRLAQKRIQQIDQALSARSPAAQTPP